MVTMIDEIFDRQYRAGRTDLNDALVDLGGRFGKAIGETFAVLNRIEYSAPWTAKSSGVRMR
jgi:hypothetical protein